MKTWNVFHTYFGFLGTVRASRKYIAMVMAERDFHVRPGMFYLGLVR